MKRLRTKLFFAFLAVTLTVTWQSAAGQQAAPGAGSYTPRKLSDGQPDIQGVWRVTPGGSYSIEFLALQAFNRSSGFGNGLPDIETLKKQSGSRIVDPPDGRIPYQPWAAAKAKELFDTHTEPTPETLDPQARCWLQGTVRATYQSENQILQTPGQVVFLMGWGHSYRVVPLAAKSTLPENMKLFMGDSVGRWEGKTLIIDVTNNNHLTWFDVVGSFHSDQMRATQRFTIVDAKTIDYQVTITDPKVYSRPWTMRYKLVRADDDEELWEEACHEGNRSVEHMLARPANSPR